MQAPNASCFAVLSGIRKQLAPLPSSENVASASDTPTWNVLAAHADALAAALRDPAERTQATHTQLAPSLVSLMNQASACLVSEPHYAPAFVETLTQFFRLAANFVADNNGARQQLIQHGFLHAAASTLERAPYRLPSTSIEEKDYLLVRSIVASVLNIAFGDPSFLTSIIDQPSLMHELLLIASPLGVGKAGQVYAPGQSSSEAAAMAATWAWQLLDQLASHAIKRDEAHFSATWGSKLVQTTCAVLQAFLAVSPRSDTGDDGDATNMYMDATLLSMAVKVLEEAADASEVVRVALLDPLEGTSSCGLQVLVEILERASPPQAWPRPDATALRHGTTTTATDSDDEDEDEAVEAHKMYATAKGAVGRTMVIVAGEDKLMDRLFQGQGNLLSHVEQWLDQATESLPPGAAPTKPRSDLTALGLLVLGNLARSETNVAALAARDVGTRAAALLKASIQPASSQELQGASIMRAGGDVRISHGALGLLKNLAVAQLPQVRTQLLTAGTITTASQLLSTSYDVARPVQQSAASVIKLLAQDDAEAALQVAVPHGDNPSILQDLALLAGRSDDTGSKLQAARAVAATVRCVLRPHPGKGSATHIQEAKVQLGTEVVVQCLVQLVVDGQSARHAQLEAEAVLALTLIASHIRPGGASTIARHLVRVPPAGLSPSKALSTIIVSPPTTGFNRPEGVRANACALVLAILQLPPGVPEPVSATDNLPEEVDDEITPAEARHCLANGVLEALQQAQASADPVGTAAKAALSVATPWAAATP